MRIKLALTLLLLTTYLLRAEPPAMQKELADLQGRWEMTSMAYDGERRDGISIWFKIEGDQMFAEMSPDDPGTIKLDPSQNPAWFDVTDRNGHINLGIYKLEGNVLTICASDTKDRPTKFESTAGSKNYLNVFKREE